MIPKKEEKVKKQLRGSSLCQDNYRKVGDLLEEAKSIRQDNRQKRSLLEKAKSICKDHLQSAEIHRELGYINKEEERAASAKKSVLDASVRGKSFSAVSRGKQKSILFIILNIFKQACDKLNGNVVLGTKASSMLKELIKELQDKPPIIQLEVLSPILRRMRVPSFTESPNFLLLLQQLCLELELQIARNPLQKEALKLLRNLQVMSIALKRNSSMSLTPSTTKLMTNLLSNINTASRSMSKSSQSCFFTCNKSFSYDESLSDDVFLDDEFEQSLLEADIIEQSLLKLCKEQTKKSFGYSSASISSAQQPEEHEILSHEAVTLGNVQTPSASSMVRRNLRSGTDAALSITPLHAKTVKESMSDENVVSYPSTDVDSLQPIERHTTFIQSF